MQRIFRRNIPSCSKDDYRHPYQSIFLINAKEVNNLLKYSTVAEYSDAPYISNTTNVIDRNRDYR